VKSGALTLKPLDEWQQVFDGVDNVRLDLKDLSSCRRAVEGAADVYNLAADMGGMGFIESNKALCCAIAIWTSTLITTLSGSVLSRGSRDFGR